MANKKIIELESDKNRMIIAKHMKDGNGIRAFLSGVKGAYYVISNLDLSEIRGYNFADNNNYMFENCLLKNLDLHFKNEMIYFNDCFFEGVVSLHNQGIGLTDMIDIQNTKLSSKLSFLSINSTNVVIENNEITSTKDIIITGDYCILKKNTIRAPYISVNHLSYCSLEKCNLNYLVSDYSDYRIKDSVTINGVHLLGVNPYVNVDEPFTR